MKYILIALAILLIAAGAGIYFLYPTVIHQKTTGEITSFEDCQKAGFLVVDTKPRECHTDKGQVYVEEYNGVLLQNSIVVTSPAPGDVVHTPFKVEGKAIGSWYTNNQLTVKLEDKDNNVIATKQVNALSDTNTGDFVNFVAAIDFSGVTTDKGKLVIESPSGNYPTGESGPLIIPIKFK